MVTCEADARTSRLAELAAMLECQSPGVWWRAVGMTADDARRAPWRGDWDEVVLRLLASGVVEFADRVVSGQPVRLPYPVSLQRVLDRLSVASESLFGHRRCSWAV